MNSMPPVFMESAQVSVVVFTTTIFSMLCNASRDRFYDIVVLERNIDYRNKRDIESLVAEFGCACVRFVNVERMIDGYDLSTNNEHISLETYYRFLVQEILSSHDKVLYLDCDLIVRGDVAELYDTPLGDNLLAAAHDIDYLGNLNMNDGKRMRYTTDVLGLADPYAYFQAGVLVLNTREMRLLHSVPEWMRIVSDANYIYDDQDILNAECQGRVTFLPFDWNVMHDCGGRVDAVFKFAPNDVFDAYNASRRSNGIDYNRAAMLLAVLEKRGGLSVAGCDSYINVIGGLTLEEPAADLATMLAVASSFLDRPLGADLAAIGEVGLSGEIRSVSALNQRLSEIARLGFKRCIIPAHIRDEVKHFEGLKIIAVRNVSEAVAAVLSA